MVVILHVVVFVFTLLLSKHGGESSDVFTVESPSQTIEAAVGEDVDFFCPLTNEVSAEMMEVRWVYPERCSPSVVHIYRNGRDDNLKQDPYFRGRTEILTEDIGKGIVGLRLRNISASDKGTYLCQIQSKVAFFEAALQLKVSEGAITSALDYTAIHRQHNGRKSPEAPADRETLPLPLSSLPDFKDPHVSSFYSHFIEGLHPSMGLKCTPKGISFKMDNGMYWSSMPNGIRGKKDRDHTCWFQVCQMNDGNVEITDYKGNYLSLDPRDYRKSIKTVKRRNQPYSQFEVQYENEKVLFKASNGLFLSRIYYTGIERHTIEAQKNPKDVFSLFDLVSAYA